MESVVTALLSSGPIGILAVLQTFAIGALWLSVNKTRAEHVADLKRCVEALTSSTSAIEESNMGRQSFAEAIKRVGDSQLHLLGRVEVMNALIENGPRRRG